MPPPARRAAAIGPSKASGRAGPRRDGRYSYESRKAGRHELVIAGQCGSPRIAAVTTASARQRADKIAADDHIDVTHARLQQRIAERLRIRRRGNEADRDDTADVGSNSSGDQIGERNAGKCRGSAILISSQWAVGRHRQLADCRHRPRPPANRHRDGGGGAYRQKRGIRLERQCT